MIYINRLNKKVFNKKISYILCDFDRTISTYNSSTSWGMFRISKRVPKGYQDDSNKLFEKYRPIELNNKIDSTIKKEHMKRWVLEQVNLFSKYGIDINLYHEIIENEIASIVLRNDFPSFARDMYLLDIPIYIVSGGLIDPIEYILKSNECLYPNIDITTNMLDERNGKIVGLKEPVIHALNKNTISLPISSTGLGLLFGDLPEDKLLGNNLDTIDCGFVNDADTYNYNKEFDICLTGESSFTQVSKLLIKK